MSDINGKMEMNLNGYATKNKSWQTTKKNIILHFTCMIRSTGELIITIIITETETNCTTFSQLKQYPVDTNLHPIFAQKLYQY